jgi:hypothetical protein
MVLVKKKTTLSGLTGVYRIKEKGTKYMQVI